MTTPSLFNENHRTVLVLDDKVSSYRDVLLHDREYRNKLGRCPICNGNIADRKVALFQELILALYKIYCWCGEKRRHEFETKEIKHMLSKNDYARFGDLVRFGGIVYKPKGEDNKSRKAWFGINMARAKEFFHGDREIPVQITLNQITNEIIESKYVKVNEIPQLVTYLGEHGLYDYEKEI
jgi:hypothetical protein